MTWDGHRPGTRERAEVVCRAACPGERECACSCHDAGDRVASRVRALMRERFGVLAS